VNLNELLTNIDQLAEEGLEIPAEIMPELRNKIDGYYNAIKALEAISEHLGQEAARVKQRQQQVENNIQRMRDYLFFNMKHFGWDEIRGACHKAKIVKQKKFVIHHNPQMYIDHEFVISKTFYEFDKDKLKKLVESDKEKYANIANFEEKETVRLT